MRSPRGVCQELFAARIGHLAADISLCPSGCFAELIPALGSSSRRRSQQVRSHI
jgi:hypothetical protein